MLLRTGAVSRGLCPWGIWPAERRLRCIQTQPQCKSENPSLVEHGQECWTLRYAVSRVVAIPVRPGPRHRPDRLENTSCEHISSVRCGAHPGLSSVSGNVGGNPFPAFATSSRIACFPKIPRVYSLSITTPQPLHEAAAVRIPGWGRCWSYASNRRAGFRRLPTSSGVSLPVVPSLQRG